MGHNDRLLRAILAPESAERLERIRILNKERAEKIEEAVVAEFQQRRAPLSDNAFVELVERLEASRTRAHVENRRRRKIDDLEDL